MRPACVALVLGAVISGCGSSPTCPPGVEPVAVIVRITDADAGGPWRASSLRATGPAPCHALPEMARTSAQSTVARELTTFGSVLPATNLSNER
jgi:hypothetical protein